MSEGFLITYVPLARLWCNRPGCGWSRRLPALDPVSVARAEADHLTRAHTSDDLGNSGP